MLSYLGPLTRKSAAASTAHGRNDPQCEAAREALRRQIALGVEQAGRGEFVDGPQLFANLRRRTACTKSSPSR